MRGAIIVTGDDRGEVQRLSVHTEVKCYLHKTVEFTLHSGEVKTKSEMCVVSSHQVHCIHHSPTFHSHIATVKPGHHLDKTLMCGNVEWKIFYIKMSI